MKGSTMLQSLKDDVIKARAQVLILKNVGGLELHHAEYRLHLAKNALINFKERSK